MTRNNQTGMMAQKSEPLVTLVKRAVWMGSATAALLATVGCGEGNRLVPVSGIVKVNDQPVARAGVTFIPVGGGRPAWATTDELGRFELSTKDQGDGAVVGEYLVTLAEDPSSGSAEPELEDPGLASVFGGPPQGGKSTKKKTIDLKYASRSTSDLRFTVVAGKENVAEFSFNSK